MTEPFKLVYRDVIEAALKAHNEGRLQATAGGYKWGGKYWDIESGTVCAIGAALPPPVLMEIIRQAVDCATLAGLKRRGIVACDDPDEWEELCHLQRLHDAALMSNTVTTPDDFLHYLKHEAWEQGIIEEFPA